MCVLLQSSTVTSAKEEEQFIMIRERGSGVFAIEKETTVQETWKGDELNRRNFEM